MKDKIQKAENQNEMPEGDFKEENIWGAIGLFALDFLKIFVIAIAIIVPIRYFLFQPFVVTGDSMQPNFINGDYLIIDEISYHLREPERGEVVVMRFPNDPSQFFIKRIVGMPEERVIIERGRVKVYNDTSPDGVVLDEEYLPDQDRTYGNIDISLDDSEYFVLGDNRLASSDSRVWGPLPKENLIGRAYIRLFPLSELQIFSTPDFQF